MNRVILARVIDVDYFRGDIFAIDLDSGEEFTGTWIGFVDISTGDKVLFDKVRGKGRPLLKSDIGIPT